MSTFLATSVGASFRPKEAKDIIRSLEIGDEIQLEREPDNAYDENAIKTLFNGTHIGYVEKDVAVEIAPLLDEDYPAKATVLSFLSDLKPHLEITVEDD